LTDFEEFAVYDCQIKPKHTDRPSTARVMHITYKDYVGRWGEIAQIFSKEAVLKGSFDKFAIKGKGKRGTSTVDKEFLEEIESWRKELAKYIALRNRELGAPEANFAVQRTIDRILFLRMCEDRGIETYGQLLSLSSGREIYRRLGELFEKADAKYNSGLFYFREEKGRNEPPDEMTLGLNVPDEPVGWILHNLYYPQSPYEFSVLPPEILGNVYEQFLGQVIRITPGRMVKIEDKPEVKKAGGVYYTPEYIVDYIVKNTVGKLCEGKTLKQISKLRILDPACGSGSFLLGAYTYFLNYHRDWYFNNEPEKYKKQIYQGKGGKWYLTIPEKKRILLNNIFGVDIDYQAVEVTKLSLLLKVLEGENQETVQQVFRSFHERALPDLGNNIKCGNSLIGTDFYEIPEVEKLTEEELKRINAFDWEKEFEGILSGKNPGFDTVIGNPPWGALFTEPELEYLRQNNSEVIVRMIDSFMYFVYRCSKKLKSQGLFGMILPDVILYQTDNQKLREFILDYSKIHHILNMGDVFHKVTRPACIIIFEKGQSTHQLIETADLSKTPKTDKAIEIWKRENFENLPQSSITDIPGLLFVTSNLGHYSIWAKIKSASHQKLKDLVDEDGIQRGVSPDLKEAFLLDSDTAKKWNLESSKLRKVLTGGRQVKRYFIQYPDLLLIYTSRDDDFSKLQNICAYINQFKERITCKEVKENKHSLYSLHRARNESIFLKNQKLIGVITEDEIVLALDEELTFTTDGLYLFGLRDIIDVKYLMGILNAKLFVFIYRLLALELGRTLAQVKPTVLAQLPIRTIDFSNSDDKRQHDKIVSLVERMLGLNKKLREAKVPGEKERLQREINATDKQIDNLVYKLYGLTDEEIAIVEGIKD